MEATWPPSPRIASNSLRQGLSRPVQNKSSFIAPSFLVWTRLIAAIYHIHSLIVFFHAYVGAIKCSLKWPTE
jgi:hypothetical protein